MSEREKKKTNFILIRVQQRTDVGILRRIHDTFVINEQFNLRDPNNFERTLEYFRDEMAQHYRSNWVTEIQNDESNVNVEKIVYF